MGEVLPHWLDKQASLNPEKTALVFPGAGPVSFSKLQKNCRSYAGRLAAAGVEPGSRIALLAGNNLEFVTALHALSYLGAVAVLLNTRLNEHELAFQLDDAEVSLLLADKQFLKKGEKAAELATTKLNVQVFSSLPEMENFRCHLKQEVDLDDPATIIYTSGTTGFPKGVCHTYGNHWWSAVSSALNLGLSANDKWLAVLPFFHVSGLSILMKSLIYGMPVHVLEKFDEAAVRDSIFQSGITLVSLVSVLLDKLLAGMGNSFFPASFRGVLLGGGPAPEAMLKRAVSQKVNVFQSYGMTETSSQIATLSPGQSLRKLGSAGMPLFPAQLKIMIGQREARAGAVGEIWVKGPMVSAGYYRNEEANRTSFQNSWLATGDAGYVDEEGYLYVLDRRKDLIISGGENVYPAEIESVLSGIAGIREAGVIGKRDSTWGQVPVAFLVGESEYDAEAIKQFCRKKLAPYKIPAEIFFVEELPRNASNKLLRRELTKWMKEKKNE